MSLEVPSNTPDPAATPLTLRFADDEQRRIKRVRVFIDNNPSPLVATFDFASATPVTEINMRVRIDRFTSVRAVAETADGGLEMRSAWVKASGGCSAPSSAAPGGVLGEIRLRPSTDTKSLLTSIRHPNSSGFQIDPRTGDAIPAHYKIVPILCKAPVFHSSVNSKENIRRLLEVYKVPLDVVNCYFAYVIPINALLLKRKKNSKSTSPPPPPLPHTFTWFNMYVCCLCNLLLYIQFPFKLIITHNSLCWTC